MKTRGKITIKRKRSKKEKVIISKILNKYLHYGYRKVNLESKKMEIIYKGETNEAFNVCDGVKRRLSETEFKQSIKRG